MTMSLDFARRFGVFGIGTLFAKSSATSLALGSALPLSLTATFKRMPLRSFRVRGSLFHFPVYVGIVRACRCPMARNATNPACT